MLKGLDPRMTADLLDLMMRMGHGDELALVDRNYPAHAAAAGTPGGRVVELAGFTAPEALAMICRHLPLDAFVPEGAWWMEEDGQGGAPNAVHAEALEILRAEMPEGGAVGHLERQAFYERARKAYGVVRCTEARPFGCFILRKGVVF